MAVLVQDKRRSSQSVCALHLANSTGFDLLDIPGMSELINTQQTNDEINVTPAVAKKMAVLIAGWCPPDYWAQGIGSQTMKLFVLEFLLTCNGFRTS